MQRKSGTLGLMLRVARSLTCQRPADIVRVEDGKLAEHWDVLQDEATKAESVSGLFGDRFPG
jgi:hypothetical protein